VVVIDRVDCTDDISRYVCILGLRGVIYGVLEEVCGPKDHEMKNFAQLGKQKW